MNSPNNAAHPIARQLIDMIDALPESNSKLINHAGYSISSLSEWRSGTIKFRQLTMVQNVAQALGYDLVLVALDETPEATDRDGGKG